MAILAHEPRTSARSRRLIPLVTIATLATAIAVAQPAASGSAIPIAATSLVAAAPAVVAAAPAIPLALAAAEPAQTLRRRDLDCATETDAAGSPIYVRDGITLSGSMLVIVGSGGGDRVIHKSFADLHLCIAAEGVPDGGATVPSDWTRRANRIVLQSRRGSIVQRFEATRQAGGAERVVWSVGGAERPFDADAEAWRTRMLALLDGAWELSVLQSEANTLRGEISTVRGQESTQRAEMSTLAAELSTMQSQISAIRGQESTLHAEISTIEAQLGTLRGALSEQRGAISALEAVHDVISAMDRNKVAASIRSHEQEVARLQKEIQNFAADKKITAVEARLRALDAEGKIAAIEKEMKTFDFQAKVAGVEKLIRDLDVAEKIAEAERKLAQLDEAGRGRALEEQVQRELRQLQDLLARIK